MLFGRLRNGGFLLLEALLSITIGIVIICSALGVFAQCVRLFSLTLEQIEEKEQALSALYTVFHLARYGDNAVVSEGGKRLTVRLRNSTLSVYAFRSSLLLAHKGTANPIAEGCTGVAFSLLQHSLTARISFGNEVYTLQVLPGYFKR
ncbi:PulJ/GspJ family protein [Candidatus Caldatribacterium sp. SIUC1]|uniref:PulJ/GspJ family protein n=1 Tax=Candidatus Caldatribacterium sp. SIUC1 TaxID=3418365 RepID=UPI003F68F308